MRTTDLFKNNRSAKKLNESLQKTFGKHIDLKSMDLPRLEDARNKLRTQLHDARSQSGFNENLENEAYTQAQWMLDAINSEIAEREEFIADPHQATVEYDTNEGYSEYQDEFDSWMNSEYAPRDDEAGDDNTLMQKASAFLQGMVSSDQIDDAAEILVNMFYGEGDEGNEPSGSYDSSDDADALASAGFGSDEDYGNYGQDEDFDADAPVGSTKDTRTGTLTKTKTGTTHRRDYDKKIDSPDFLPGEEPELDPKPRGYHPGHGGSLTQRSVGRRPKLSDESIAMEKAPPGDKYERMVKHIKKGYAKDGKLSDKERSIAYATAWKQKNKANESEEQVDELKRSTVKSYAIKKMDRVKTDSPTTSQKAGKDLKGIKNAQARLKGEKPTSESVTTGEDMTKLYEGEIQQASAIVNAKTMVDRVGRWIEELSGMENDTLLQLGDSIRDEMSAELAKSFISSVAPAIQQALESLKGTRETLASGMRMLTGEEQGAEMLGAEPGAGSDMGGDLGGDEFGGESEPDMMNMGGEEEMGGPSPDDAFAAAEPGAGGLETAGREQRESINRSNSLLKILAG